LLAVALLVLLYFAQARELKRVSEWAAREAERPRPPMPLAQPSAAGPPAPPQPLPVAPPAPAGANVAQRPPGGPVVAATVPGVRRVKLGTAATAAPATAVEPPPAGEQAPDATTIGGSAVASPADGPDTATASPTAAPAPGHVPQAPDAAAAPAAGQAAEIPASSPVEGTPAGAVPLAASAIAQRVAGEQYPAEGDDDPSLLPPAPGPSEPRLPPAPHKDSPVIATAAGGPRLPPPPPRRGSAADEEVEDRPRRQLRRLRDGEGEPSRAGRRRLIVFVVVIVLVAAAVVVKELGGSSKTPSKTHSPSAVSTNPRSSTHSSSNSTAPGHASITVAVLNGTNTPGEAGKVSATLTADGYVAGRVADAPDQNTPTTTVGYTPGHQAAAEEVAHSLGLAGLTASPVDTADQSAASAQGTTPQVVVVIGANYPQ
jgi:hypothetical protein